MPSGRNSIGKTLEPTSVRRSPRLQQLHNEGEHQLQERSRNPKPKSINNLQTRPTYHSPSSAENVSVNKNQKINREKDTKKSKKATYGSEGYVNMTNGLRRSLRFSNGVDDTKISKKATNGLKNYENLPNGLRRSPRFFRIGIDVTTISKKAKKATNRSKIDENLPNGLRRSPRFFSNGVDDTKKSKEAANGYKNYENLRNGLRRFPRFVSNVVDDTKEAANWWKNYENLTNGLRRSPRFFSNGVDDTKNSNKATNGSKNCENLLNESRRSPRFCKGVDRISCIRRPPRFTDEETATKHVEQKRERRPRSKSFGSVTDLVEEGERKERDVELGDEEIGVRKKRKKAAEGDEGFDGWSKEQELTLQRAYFTAKPTPHFWKKVAKMVPGKSAQDCFDKFHSGHLNSPQRQPRSRAKRTKLSSNGNLSLSASKLLQPIELKIRRPTSNKHKSRLAQKAVRRLLRKHYDLDQDYEADLFSVLEPNIDKSSQVLQESLLHFTPKNAVEKSGYLQKCFERSSSNHKKPLSRFSSLYPTPLVSPPVLKEVKSRALHEKYIDQLHKREAKRKAASAQTANSRNKFHSKDNYCKKLDVVKAAKNALVSDARDVISQFQHLEAGASVIPSEIDDDEAITDTDDEGEDGP